MNNSLHDGNIMGHDYLNIRPKYKFEIQAWMINYTPQKLCEVITYACPHTVTKTKNKI